MRSPVSHVDEGTLHAYLDGELPGDERTRLEAHLAECAACRDRLTEERGLIERADRLLTLAALPAGHTLRPAPESVRRPRRQPRFVVPTAWAASIALAFFTGWLLRPGPRSSGYVADEAKIAAAVPADTPGPAPTRDAGGRATLERVPVERRQAAKALPDSAASADLSYSRSETSASVSVTPGVVGNAGRPALRGGAPAPIPPVTVAVTPAPRSPSVNRFAEAGAEPASPRRPIGTTWTAITAEPARKLLGTDVVSIPGIPVRDILQNAQAPGQVMVEQEVADGTIIQLLQSRLDSTPALTASQSAALYANPLQKTVGRLQVRISGPLKTDSLLKLLDLAR
ncbi:MAG TPA: zf-HC2 domain-containing protein [Gemmatimonadales bacterium]|nr:zf-HC2 domain-containing protein [Gemmatimonadales bacterium]